MNIASFHASCKCGAVQYAVRVDPERAVPCICARCRGLGLQVAYVPRSDFRLFTGRDNLTESMDGARTPHHFFCRTCGEASFGRVGETVSVNLACLGRGNTAILPDIAPKKTETAVWQMNKEL